jgi:hypothetical protein
MKDIYPREPELKQREQTQLEKMIQEARSKIDLKIEFPYDRQVLKDPASNLLWVGLFTSTSAVFVRRLTPLVLVGSFAFYYPKTIQHWFNEIKSRVKTYVLNYLGPNNVVCACSI